MESDGGASVPASIRGKSLLSECELQLFPGRRTSENPGGWNEYSEGNQIVRMWVGNWRNTSGVTVTYVIRYRWPHERRLDASAIAEVQALISPRTP